MGCENTVFSDLQKDFQQVAHEKKTASLANIGNVFLRPQNEFGKIFFNFYDDKKRKSFLRHSFPPQTKKRKCPIFVLLLRVTDRLAGLGRRRHFSRQSYRRFPQKKKKKKIGPIHFRFFPCSVLSSCLLAAGAQTTDTHKKSSRSGEFSLFSSRRQMTFRQRRESPPP